MTPKFIEHMKIAIMSRVPVHTPVASIKFDATRQDAMRSLSSEINYEYSARCEIFFTDIAPVGDGDKVRERAVASFTHHLYGEIRNELFEVMQALRDRDCEKASDLVCILLDDLT